ncbi:MAG: acetylxylan esterase [Armatimonadetes bacterium]|nr:acetylxylan esterase [Armatimonadota bacterium]
MMANHTLVCKATVFAVIILVLTFGTQCFSAHTLDVGSVVDKRYEVIRDPDTPCDITSLMRFRSLKEWNSRAAQLRQQILASAGLLPMPERTPLNARVFGKIDRGDYVVEKVYFESYPGYYVTGNLYRPNSSGRFPAVLNPHGHWENGRFEDNNVCSVPGRCINFAKQGYVAFSYDMVGFGDSWQMVHSAYPNNHYGNTKEMLGGRYADLNTDVIGFRKDQLLWGTSVGGLQLWNSIRAVDFLQSLPYVDKNRIACTGASGGGTQTYLLSAVDDRIKVCAPVCMVSAKRQGGCLCENLPNLRIDTNNVELAALMAPRPMVLISATGDWTRDVPNVELPVIRHIYDLYGAGDKVSCVLIDDEHNYNRQGREAVYSWFGRWLPSKSLPQPVREHAFQVENVQDLRVFPEKKAPIGALDKEGLVRRLIAMSKAQFDANRPKDIKSLDHFRKLYSPVLRQALSLNDAPDMEAEARGEDVRADCVVTRLVLRDRTRGAEVPAILFRPLGNPLAEAVLMVHEDGKQGFLNSTGDAGTRVVYELVKSGREVLLIDCFGTDEHMAPEGSARRSLQESPNESSAYKWSFTYNRTDTAERVYDILCALNYLQGAGGTREVSVVGSGRAGLWCMLATAFARGIGRTAYDTAALDTSSDEAFVKDFDVPCLRKAGDFNTAIAIAVPRKMLIHNTQGKFDTSWARDVYKAAGQVESIKVTNARASDDQVIRWLLGAGER